MFQQNVFQQPARASNRQGARQAQRAVALASGAGERGYEAWARKLLGDVIQEESSDPTEALDQYAASIALATELAMGSSPLQAHIHLSLGQLHRR
jgi:hypothetical protein